ncbi:MAG: prepilin peptidase [Bacillota bacterium]|nr:prepilin peptidase [Bacillota bacterium]
MLAYFLFRLSKVDLEIRQIPDEYSLAICILAVGAGGFPLNRVCLALAIMTLSGCVMGMGDAKLFGALCLIFSWRIFTIFALSFFLAAFYCVPGLLARRISLRDSIAFAPFITVATLSQIIAMILQ